MDENEMPAEAAVPMPSDTDLLNSLTEANGFRGLRLGEDGWYTVRTAGGVDTVRTDQRTAIRDALFTHTT